jgi:hypothetical protein
MQSTDDTTEETPGSGTAVPGSWQPMVVPDSPSEGEAPPRTQTPTEEWAGESGAYTAEEEALVEERLKNLGYL